MLSAPGLKTLSISASIAALAGAATLVACGRVGAGTGGGAQTSTTVTSTQTTGTGSGPCVADPLKTGLTAQQTGMSVDLADCPILEWSAKYGEPDAMVFKAIIYVESRFQYDATACTNLPCSTPAGWTSAESQCFGLMQVVPACGGLPANEGLLPNGHPNLTKDMTSPDYMGSIFNPEINVAVGIAGISKNRQQEMQKFPGCTDDQYTMMAIGDYNSYGSTMGCTKYNTTYDNLVITAYKQYAAAANWPAHPY